MNFKERLLIQENIQKYLIPTLGAGVAGYLGYDAANDFNAGSSSRYDPESLFNDIIGQGPGTPKEELKKLITFDGGSMKDIGRAYANEAEGGSFPLVSSGGVALSSGLAAAHALSPFGKKK